MLNIENRDELKNIVEAILFVAGELVSVETLAEALELESIAVENFVDEMMMEYSENKRGIHIIKIDKEYQMCSNPEFFKYIEKIYNKPKKFKITDAALEILAIVAYKQPITKNEISDIRGVNCDYHVNKLLELNLICEKGRLDAPGRPILFGTTKDFLRYYGVSNVEDLPVVSSENLEAEANSEVEQLKI